MERQFVQQYPKAHLDRFKFNVILSKTGDVTGTSVTFKVRDGQFLDITTDDFKNLYSINQSELYLKNTQSFQHLLISKRGVHQSHYHKINP